MSTYLYKRKYNIYVDIYVKVWYNINIKEGEK